ncbi:MAG: response regulator [Candidatus Omnitrophica bacterium]|nr:response regulator [Candidatus Omnitrophota bacterium]
MSPFRKKILVVDDDEDDYSLMSDAFKESCASEVELDWKKDGAEALEYFFNQTDGAVLPAIVLLDLNMPKVDGREVLKRLRSAVRFQHVPVVVFTNSADRRDILESYRMGANSYVRKPSGYGELVRFARAFCAYWFKYSSFID